MAQRLLLISYYFAPRNAIGAVRPTKLAKYLTRMGYEVTVLCAQPYTRQRDPVLQRDMAGVHAVRVVRERSLLRWWKERGQAEPPTPALTERKHLPSEGARDAAQDAGAKPLVPAPQPPPVRKAASRAHRVLDALYRWLTFTADAAFARACLRELDTMGQLFDVVISTYGPHSVHTVARKAKAAGVAARWIADFRDELTVPFRWMQGFQARYLRRVRAQADAITAVSAGFLKMMGLDGLGHVVPNGFDREDAALCEAITLPGDALHFAYCGHIYPGQADLGPVFAAIRALADQGACDPKRLRFHYAGSEGAVFRAAAAREGLADAVVDHGLVSRARSVGLQQAADALLAATWNNARRVGVVTGKLMEYLMAGKPILLCVQGEIPGSDARAIIEETHTGTVYEQACATADIKALQAALLALYQAKMAGAPLPYAPDAQAVQQYDYASIAGAFARLIDNA
ncbi:MAG: hypothetical protein VB087_06685 [Candidatus Limiplasma sp.]|nr:hypothetical protein [Candidatus Limiplasma sp.]